MKELDIWVDELPPSYPAGDTRELDKWVRALGRKQISRDTFEDISPSIGKRDIAESLKRLYDRGQLTNPEIQDTMELFGKWPDWHIRR